MLHFSVSIDVSRVPYPGIDPGDRPCAPGIESSCEAFKSLVPVASLPGLLLTRNKSVSPWPLLLPSSCPSWTLLACGLQFPEASTAGLPCCRQPWLVYVCVEQMLEYPWQGDEGGTEDNTTRPSQPQWTGENTESQGGSGHDHCYPGCQWQCWGGLGGGPGTLLFGLRTPAPHHTMMFFVDVTPGPL